MKTEYKLKLDLSKVPAKDREKVKREVGNYVLEKTLEDVSQTRSPVTGRPFRPLKKGPYLKEKRAQAGTTAPNLELTGDMLDALEFRSERGGVRIGVFKESESLKADNHNKFSSKSQKTKVPARKFIPVSKNKEQYRPEIRKEIQTIIEEFETNGES